MKFSRDFLQGWAAMVFAKAPTRSNNILAQAFIDRVNCEYGSLSSGDKGGRGEKKKSGQSINTKIMLPPSTVAMLFGLWNMIGVITGDLGCLVAGAFQIVSGLLVMLIESPCCFICAEQFQKVADMADTRPLWQRAALYCG